MPQKVQRDDEYDARVLAEIENDPLIALPIGPAWLEAVNDKILRIFARLVLQLERFGMTTSSTVHGDYVRSLKDLQRTFERIAQQETKRVRTSRTPEQRRDALATLERRLLALAGRDEAESILEVGGPA